MMVPGRKLTAIDARTVLYPGIGRYVRELSAELLKAANPDDFVFLADPDAGDELAKAGAIHIRKARASIYGPFEQIEMLHAARGADLFHAPHFNAPLFWKKKLVVTIHDLIYLRHPESLASPLKRAWARHLIGSACRRADALIAVSEHTKKDILEEFPDTAASKISVIHEAAAPAFAPASAADIARVRAKYDIRDPFVLFVGTLKPHKNLPALFSAMSSILKNRKGMRHELVLAGRSDGKHPEILRDVAAYSFVRRIGQVSDGDLPALYSAADVFVLPSFYEGFGLPVLEAMACGTPVIVSNASSLPEVAGEAAPSFDPARVDALAEILYTVLENKKLREKMSLDGLERAKRFSWKKTAAETLKVYERVLS